MCRSAVVGVPPSLASLRQPAMSLCKWHDTVEPGNVVIIYEGVERMSYVVAETGAIFSNRFGHFHHDDIIGQAWGVKWNARSSTGGRKGRGGKTGYVYILHPTPELWTLALSHRTQILYTPDISMVRHCHFRMLPTATQPHDSAGIADGFTSPRQGCNRSCIGNGTGADAARSQARLGDYRDWHRLRQPDLRVCQVHALWGCC